jgi:hypothetical protein
MKKAQSASSTKAVPAQKSTNNTGKRRSEG